MNKILFLLILFLPGLLCSQQKYEKEYRITTEDLPTEALNYINAFPFDKKIKWYREESLNTSSIEAKTRYKKQKYSIEFSKDGVFEDIEIKIPFKSIPTKTKSAITSELNSFFNRYNITKVQVQYLGDLEAILALVKNNQSSVAITQNYEIVVHGKKDGTYSSFEFLFDKDGMLLRKSQIVLRNTDNLEY